MNTKNQTPAAIASRHEDDRLFDAETALREIAILCTGNDPSDSDDICASDVVGMVRVYVEPRAGLEPGAVAGLVAAAERMVAALAQEREMRGIAGDGSRVEAELRAALAAAKGGAK